MADMVGRINSYFAVLLITIAGAGATFLIVHAAFADIAPARPGGATSYAELEQSILGTSPAER